MGWLLGAAAAVSNHDSIVTTDGLSRAATGSSSRWRRRCCALKVKGALFLALQRYLSLVGYHIKYLGAVLAASRFFDLARLKCVFGGHMMFIRRSRTRA